MTGESVVGGTYTTAGVLDLDPPPDVIVEATGASQIIVDAMSYTAANGIVCLTGISSGGHKLELDAGVLNRSIVLENDEPVLVTCLAQIATLLFQRRQRIEIVTHDVRQRHMCRRGHQIAAIEERVR